MHTWTHIVRIAALVIGLELSLFSATIYVGAGMRWTPRVNIYDDSQFM